MDGNNNYEAEITRKRQRIDDNIVNDRRKYLKRCVTIQEPFSNQNNNETRSIEDERKCDNNSEDNILRHQQFPVTEMIRRIRERIDPIFLDRESDFNAFRRIINRENSSPSGKQIFNRGFREKMEEN